MKIIAFYLPQFHSIPENDEWWGKGFTEWTNVKKAKSLFNGHEQPKVPLNNNYYNLLDDNVKIWQAQLAKKYGIYGFCYYHYWYNGHMLLEKPMEQMLKNKNVDIPFCIWWCNQPWTKSWVGNDNKVLISQKYGDKNEWIEHYKYLRQFFLDKRYILNENKPIIGIYQPAVIEPINEIKECWVKLAREDGFDGIDLMCTFKSFNISEKERQTYKCFNHFVEWSFTLAVDDIVNKSRNTCYTYMKNVKNRLNEFFKRKTGKDLPISNLISKLKRLVINKGSVTKYDYDVIWNEIIGFKHFSNKSIPGAIVNWDNTARYGINGSVIINSSAYKFEKYLSKQIKNARSKYNSDMIFLQAWNEWAEWSVLEPDEINKYDYLQAVKNALIANKEFPNYE